MNPFEPTTPKKGSLTIGEYGRITGDEKSTDGGEKKH